MAIPSTIAVAFHCLEWHAAPMPGSTGPVRLALLPVLSDGAFRAFVQFPAGWARLGAGHYPVAEEFLVLEGDLRLNDTTWRAGGYAWVPANRVRSASRSESGCLAFAWFSSLPRWTPGEPRESALPCDVSLAHWRDARDLVPGGRELYAGPEHHTWIVDRPRLAGLAVPGTQWETLGLNDRTWHSGPTHEASDDPVEEVLVRVWQLPQ